MSQKTRVVCLIVADESGTHSTIDRYEFERAFAYVMHQFGASEDEVLNSIEIILGNDEVPRNFSPEPEDCP